MRFSESLRVAFPAACGAKRSRQRARRPAHHRTRTAHRLILEYPAPWGGDPLFILLTIPWCTSRPALADDIYCQMAIDDYNILVKYLPDYIRTYYKCIASSRGKDSCVTPFLDLQSQQNRFQSKVSEILTFCGPSQ